MTVGLLGWCHSGNGEGRDGDGDVCPEVSQVGNLGHFVPVDWEEGFPAQCVEHQYRGDFYHNLLLCGQRVPASGATVLHLVSIASIARTNERKRTEVVSDLLRLGADAAATDSLGATPLHYAACRGDSIVVAMLAQAANDADLRDNVQSTPLHYAAGREGGDSAAYGVARALLRMGAPRDARDSLGNTPIMVAKHVGLKDVVRGYSESSRCERFCGTVQEFWSRVVSALEQYIDMVLLGLVVLVAGAMRKKLRKWVCRLRDAVLSWQRGGRTASGNEEE